MQRIQLAEDLEFSRVIHGLWRLNEWNVSDGELLNLIEWCISQGITTFDHADIYGGYTCEKLFGGALSLSPSIRERIEIVTKCGIVIESPERPGNKSHHYNTSKSHILASAEQSLLNLNTDYLDVLLIHRPDPLMDPEAVAEAFHALKSSGKVRYFGVSNFKAHQYRMLESYLDDPLITNQIEISAYELENIHDGTLDFCQENAFRRWRGHRLRAGASLQDNQIRTSESVPCFVPYRKKSALLPLTKSCTHGCSPTRQTSCRLSAAEKNRISAAVRASAYKLSHDQWFRIYTGVQGCDIP